MINLVLFDQKLLLICNPINLEKKPIDFLKKKISQKQLCLFFKKKTGLT